MYAPYPACDRGVSLGLGDEVTQKGACAEEAEADVSGLGEVTQHRRVGEVLRSWPSIDQRHHNLHNTAFILIMDILLELGHILI